MTRAALRLVTVAFCTLAAAYALLCASAFTFHDFIRSDMFRVGTFAAWHARLYWVWLLIAVLDMRMAVSGRGRSPWIFAGVWAGIGAYLSIRPVLPTLADDHRSVVVAILALVPLLWLAAVDHWSSAPFLSDRRHRVTDAAVDRAEGRLLVAAGGSAVFLAVGSAVLVPVLMRGHFEPDLLNAGLTLGLLWTLAAASVLFCGGFLVLASVLRIVREASMMRQYALLVVIATAAVALGIDRAVCQTLGFVGVWRGAVCVLAASSLVATWGALQLRRFSDAGVRPSSPVDLLFAAPHPAASTLAIVWPLGAIVAAAYGVAILTRTVDWDFVILTSAMTLLWMATFIHFFRAAPARVCGGRALATICLLPLALWLAASAAEIRWPAIRRTLNRYTVYNGSLRLAERLLRRSTAGITPFQRYLRENTGLANTEIEPINLEFVSPLEATPRRPPHVFLFVIDSLRPDYLSPYNRAVTFTPRIAQFASESIVFQNAMTRYGATGLSLPAIWSGAVGVHRQYVMPFSPMNTLEKLLTVNRYRRVMSTDVLMERLLMPWPDTIELDRGRRTLDYDLCATLSELEARFPGGTPSDPPVFGYSNPQNLHLSNLMIASVPEGERYEGFHGPYATRVHAVDQCFGAFVDFLKARHLYDRSVIVLTSDHGELLGEEGRWGHAYYLFPQILQIPLIVHTPSGAAGDDAFDAGALSFSTDISPTVYAALGYLPRPANRLMGESLIGPAKIDALRRRRGDYVVEASYSAVYGVVRKNGRRVYIIDAGSGSEYAYERTRAEGWRAVQVVDAIRLPAQRIIREHVDEIRRVYHLPASK